MIINLFDIPFEVETREENNTIIISIVPRPDDRKTYEQAERN